MKLIEQIIEGLKKSEDLCREAAREKASVEAAVQLLVDKLTLELRKELRSDIEFEIWRSHTEELTIMAMAEGSSQAVILRPTSKGELLITRSYQGGSTPPTVVKPEDIVSRMKIELESSKMYPDSSVEIGKAKEEL